MRGSFLATVLILASMSACWEDPDSGVHRAAILDVHLDVHVSDVSVAPNRVQDDPKRPDRTWVLVDVDMRSPSGRQLWANDCHGQAFDSQGHLLFEFAFEVGFPAGQYMTPHARYAANSVQGLAPTSKKIVRETARATAGCAAWDWGDFPPE
jgi:hypothetical protein